MLMLSGNQDQPKKGDSDVQWRNLPWSLIHLCGEMQLCERWVLSPSQHPAGNEPDKAPSGISKCLKLELERRSKTRVEYKTKKTPHLWQNTKVSKAAKILDEQMIFSAYKLSMSVYIISDFITNISRIVFQVFSFIPSEVQHKVILTFSVSLSSEKCCTIRLRAGFTLAQSLLWEHSFLAWSLPVVA